MMKKTIVISLLILSTYPLLAQQKNCSGKIYDGVTFMPIQGANVYNIKTKKYAFTDNNGLFMIDASVNDTLIVSKSIYRQLIILVEKKMLSGKPEEYFLYYKAIVLKEVYVYPLNPSYEGFKRDLTKMKLDDAYSKIKGTELSKQDLIDAEFKDGGPNLLRNTPLASPITFLYNKFSKAAKMKQLYNDMLDYEEEIDKVQTKYNRELVSEITGLKGDELMNFMVFCRFSYYDIIRWTPQEIIASIKFKYSEYQYYKSLEE